MANSLPRTLPASWYCSKPLYSLEQRAVFLKSWYLLGPVTKFKENEPVVYEYAGVTLTATRATPDDSSIAVVDDKGNRPKTHLTPTGLLFSTISEAAPSFHDFFPGLEDVLSTVDFRVRPYRRSISYHGDFNWKTMVDGYQECLHCAYTHPSFSVLYPPTSYAVINHHNWCRHIADPEKPDDGVFLYLFPIGTLNVYGGGISQFRVCPTEEPGGTRMEFDYYNVEEGEKFEEYYKFVRQVAIEDYGLCEKAQSNLERGIYAEGILNPVKETGVAYYQQRVLEMVLSQHHEDKQNKKNLQHRPADGASTDATASSQSELDSSSYSGNFNFTTRAGAGIAVST
ncbi:hypothetical protein M409DRAFT_28220 [Zasmidium cellare ATCC 36951]|uniref:Choline monooxygenase, chloroplastic n=1 Tax=Zasmidium cellare ATCC 36951 TaxID=1080233 RepID=A0A6A6C360_ZASCE|nr:uncharacterized protein M409DRAFT_28220 [Zasmidium cellare ATCC 36951]KAF2161491.1 hypothetical protein M409DRAFT_28220 [Zasmidium cellare ATCC 36951]